MTTSRISSECVVLEYRHYDEYGDGSAVITTETLEKKASVGILQPHEIQRLEKAGIIIRNGATIVIKDAPEFAPDKIIHGHKTYRIVQWAFDKEFEQSDGWDEYTQQLGTVVALCDEISILGADA